jgi:cytochrome c oxidase accessory protein FixG
MREQVCFWLCPYARIQGMMYDPETILPTYDSNRGEPRGKLKKGAEADSKQGDCIDCRQCIAVCPTGIDIRFGQQEGCITCALCIDACDVVMDKIDKPRGLIRYASLNEINGKPASALFKRPRVLVYMTIMLLAIAGIIYGLSTLAGLELKVLHERQPLFVMLSDGNVQNKYELKILNKTEQAMRVRVTASGHEALRLIDAEGELDIPQGQVAAYTLYLRIPKDRLESESQPVYFQVQDVANPDYAAEYQSMFFGPAR